MVQAVCFQQEGKCEECNWATGTLYVLDREDMKGGGLCANCFAQTLVTEGYEIETDENERALFVLAVGDAQAKAQDVVGRELTTSELNRVAKGLQDDLFWDEVLTVAIEEIDRAENSEARQPSERGDSHRKDKHQQG